MTRVTYKVYGGSYYKINHDLKRITKLYNNEVAYLDYDTSIKEVNGFKSIRMEAWKNVENTFFISRHFEWVYNDKRYRTTDKPLK